MNEIENILIKKAIEGDIESFEKLIKKYQLYAYNISLKIMGNEEDAKDVAQESLIKVYKHLKSYKSDSLFSTWLYRIVVNTCKDELRKRKDIISIDEKLEMENSEIQLNIESTTYNPVLEYEKKAVKENLKKALDKLPSQNKSVLILRDIYGYSYDEICQIEGTPIGTVKSRINRGRILLRNILIKELNSELNFWERGENYEMWRCNRII